MLTTIKGFYSHGKIILAEQPPATAQAEVIITFLNDSNPRLIPRKLGGFEGRINLPDDFNEPLEDLKDYM